MAECSRCGNPTERRAINIPIGRTSNPDRIDETNGVIWFCDECMVTFAAFLDADFEELAADWKNNRLPRNGSFRDAANELEELLDGT